MFNKTKKIIFINIVAVILILLLPYYIFEGKLFIGGDDTRLYYLYPYEWIKNIALYSWFNFSSVGINNPNQFIIPLLLLLTPLKAIIQSPVIINYFIFSSVLFFGLISFQLLVAELVPSSRNNKLVVFLGGLFYITSPILLALQIANFLYSVWLIGLIPLITYLYLRFLKSNNFKYIFLAVSSLTFFSIALISIPWILGYLMSLSLGLAIGALFYSKKEIFSCIKRSFLFFAILGLSQAFWFLSFFLNFLISQKGSLGNQVLSQGYDESFLPTVLSTASGNVIYPLLNLFQRRIAFDFDWSLKDIFLIYYDKTLFLNVFFPIILLYGIFHFRKILINSEKKIFSIFLVSFLSSLFFVTVNIGFLKHLFLSLGYIPGFVMFANFWNKFDLAYILFYSIIITISLLIINKSIKNKITLGLINGFFLLLIILNAVPVKDLISTPIWTTKNVYSNLNIPREYLDFVSEVKKKVEPTSNILSLPFNIASYSFIKGDKHNEVYVGTSPVSLFTGVNDFSGDLSFSGEESSELNAYIQNRDYTNLNKFFERHAINYVFLVRNIPDELKKSFLFDRKTLTFQDEEFLEAITDRKILRSANDNYELYSTKNKSSLLISENIQFQKISPVKYKIRINDFKNPQDLVFLDSFNPGWKLFSNPNPLMGDLGFSLQRPLFDSSHKVIYGFANAWSLDPKDINPNSDSIELTLYFLPQNYFYFGIIISTLTFLLLGIYLIKKK